MGDGNGGRKRSLPKNGLGPQVKRIRFKPPSANGPTIESYFGGTGTNLLIVRPMDAESRQCRLDATIEQAGSTPAYRGAPPRLEQSKHDADTYVPQSRWAEGNAADLDQGFDAWDIGRPAARLPDVIRVDHKATGAPDHIGLWYASTDEFERKREMSAWGERYGKADIYRLLPGGSYQRLPPASRSAGWSTAADVMVSQGWPRAAIRSGDSYVDHASHHVSSDVPMQMLILDKEGEYYVSPKQLKRMNPTDYQSMMAELDLSPDLANMRQAGGPKMLALCDRKLVGGAAYDAFGEIPDALLLARIPSAIGNARSEYMRLPELLDIARPDVRGPATAERRADAAFERIRATRSRSSSR